MAVPDGSQTCAASEVRDDDPEGVGGLAHLEGQGLQRGGARDAMEADAPELGVNGTDGARDWVGGLFRWDGAMEGGVEDRHVESVGED